MFRHCSRVIGQDSVPLFQSQSYHRSQVVVGSAAFSNPIYYVSNDARRLVQRLAFINKQFGGHLGVGDKRACRELKAYLDSLSWGGGLPAAETVWPSRMAQEARARNLQKHSNAGQPRACPGRVASPRLPRRRCRATTTSRASLVPARQLALPAMLPSHVIAGLCRP
jgi:hypothetical protein